MYSKCGIGPVPRLLHFDFFPPFPLPHKRALGQSPPEILRPGKIHQVRLHFTLLRLVFDSAALRDSRYFSHPAIFSPAQISRTGWRSRTSAACLPFTSTSAASERVL